ncbi:MAG TPA: sulfotransferase [Fimbriimonadaceae bacterium]|nr:sulfotransferase [Fimbriimonadaceae bacterium]
MPLDADLVNAAQAAHLQGRLVDAERLARQALLGSPSDVGLRALLGVVLAKQFKVAEAKPLLTAVAEADAGNFESRLWLSRIFRKEGLVSESLRYGQEALALQPGNLEAVINGGLSCIDALRFEEAVELLGRAAELAPTSAMVFLHLGIALLSAGRLPEALGAYSRALELDPRLSDAHLGIGKVRLAAADLAGAAGAATSAIQLNPKNKAAHHLLLETLLEANRPAEAERHARSYLGANPDDATALTLLGRCLISVGKEPEGVQALEDSIRARPQQGAAYCLIAQTTKVVSGGEALVARMERVLADERLAPLEASYLHYGLGKAYEDLGRYAEAMERFDAANALAYRLKFGDGVLDRTTYAAQIQWTIDTFTRELLSLAEGGSDSVLPVFIVGMIRSGTTLVEQILASHASVGAGGEQRFWQAHWEEAVPGGAVDRERLDALGRTYLDVLGKLELNAPHVTDKLPGNYLRLGLLRLAFPKARIIHVRRNPVDTCLSIWTTPNAAPNEFAHDKANIVFGYREYLRLMEHWRAVLGGEGLLEIEYEQVVADRDGTARRLVEFCGMEWDEAALTGASASRPITTPSAVQARKPVYTTSVGRWERYRGLLGAFEELE